MNTTRSSVVLLINGKLHSVVPEPDTSLLTYLRSAGVGLKGTKLGCREGGCGACTVVASYFNKALGVISHRAVNACLMPLCAADGFAITTIEGLKQTAALHPIQERIVKANATQCGYCTPGIIMALYAFLLENPSASESQLETCLDGNLCRCTGYLPIVEVARSFAKKGSCTTGCSNSSDIETLAAPTIPAAFFNEERPQLKVRGTQYTWHAPHSLLELLELKKTHPDAEIVVGNTEVEITAHFKGTRAAHIISPGRVAELISFKEDDEGVFVGGALTFADLKVKLEQVVHKLDKTKTRTLAVILQQLERFANQQVRNVASLAGNLVTASATSDLSPILLATGAVVHLQSIDGNRQVNIRDWFVSYKSAAVKPNEVVVSIFIPFTKPTEFVSAFKQSRRMYDDIAIVSSCFRVLLKEDNALPLSRVTQETPSLTWENASYGTKTAVPDDQGFSVQPPVVAPPPSKCFIVESCDLTFGSMDNCTRIATNAGKYLMDKVWDFSILSGFVAELAKDFDLPATVPGGMPEYRKTMARSLFFKFFVDIYAQLYGEGAVPPKYISASKRFFNREPVKVVTDFDVKTPCCNTDVAGTSVGHIAAAKLCTGEAVFASDVDAPFHAVFVQSTKAHAKILNIDSTKALAVPGVVRVFTHKDVPGNNSYESDEEVFASSEVPCAGYPIGIVVATSHEIARKAARLVEVQYEELPAILTIEDAIKANSLLAPPTVLQTGDIEAGFKSADHVLTGEFTVSGQEHFYMETHCAIASRCEDGMNMFCSTQNPSKIQGNVASVLGITSSDVTVRCKRCGGGFGGKINRSVFVSCAVAVAAWHLKKPVKLWLDRDVDQSITGTRHPFFGRYKVGFMNTGRIVATDLQLYANCGYSRDMSIAVVGRSMFHSDNVYKIDNMRVTGYPMKTNKPTNTAFRGFGAPQGIIMMENIITRVAHCLNKPANIIRELNFYHEGQETHYGMKLENCQLQKVWGLLMEKCDLKNREREVSAFNATNRYRKRGIHCLPIKFGMPFTHPSYNQAGALVHIYLDGSVTVTHGGCELGQGLHTKMAQVAATALGIPLDLINIGDTSTDKVPNSSPTAASSQSDLNGMAVFNACKILRERLDNFRSTLKTTEPIPWVKLVNMAYNARIDLCAHGFWECSVKFDYATGKGRPYSYFVYGAACAEVEIDTLTGDHTIIRTDIAMDLGKSLNPAIDIGQIEGAFVQGCGWCTMEELVNLPNGSYFTIGPATYKIPGVADIPADFRVYFLRDVENPLAVYSSKGVGEPPLILGIVVYLALSDAVASARAEERIQGFYSLPHPASCEHIRLGCRDAFTDPTPNAGIKGESWATREVVLPPDILRKI